MVLSQIVAFIFWREPDMKRVLLLHMWSEQLESVAMAFSSSESVLVWSFNTVREYRDTFAKESASQKPGPAGLVQ